MAFTVVGWSESLDTSNVLENVAALTDPHVFISGDDIRVPDGLPFLIGIGAGSAATSFSRARITSPSLRALAPFDFEILSDVPHFGDVMRFNMFPQSPVPLVSAESINLEVLSDNVGAVLHKGIALLADGPIAPVSGTMYTIRATSTQTATEAGWTNGALTLASTLPVGRYQVVGMRARGTGLVAARLVFTGGIWRPGVPASLLLTGTSLPHFRYGGLGVFGEFHTNAPPTVDVTGGTAASFVYMLDLIRVG